MDLEEIWIGFNQPRVTDLLHGVRIFLKKLVVAQLVKKNSIGHLTVHYHVHRILTLDSILRQQNAIYSVICFTPVQNKCLSGQLKWFGSAPHLSETCLCCRYDIQYREAGSGSWNNLLKEADDTDVYFVDHLLPKTHYIFRLSLVYPHSSVPYIWPADERFAYESLGKNLPFLGEQRKLDNEELHNFLLGSNYSNSV